MISSLNGSSGLTGNNSHLRNSASQHGMRLVRQLLSQGSYFVFANIAFNHTSIVDLMKLLNLDSNLRARKELAQELHYSGDMNDSATMNVWLHNLTASQVSEIQ